MNIKMYARVTAYISFWALVGFLVISSLLILWVQDAELENSLISTSSVDQNFEKLLNLANSSDSLVLDENTFTRIRVELSGRVNLFSLFDPLSGDLTEFGLMLVDRIEPICGVSLDTLKKSYDYLMRTSLVNPLLSVLGGNEDTLASNDCFVFTKSTNLINLSFADDKALTLIFGALPAARAKTYLAKNKVLGVDPFKSYMNQWVDIGQSAVTFSSIKIDDRSDLFFERIDVDGYSWFFIREFDYQKNEFSTVWMSFSAEVGEWPVKM